MMYFDPKQKSDRVLSAGMTCFKQYGFKRTSMEDIAAAAKMSRPALYLLFKSKTDIFRSLSQEFHHQTIADAAEVLQDKNDGMKRDIRARIADAMCARMTPLYMLAHDSKHGTELFDVNQDTSGDINAAADDEFLALLCTSVQEGIDTQKNRTADIGDLAAREIAQMLLASAVGLKTFAFSTKDFEDLLRKSVSTFLHGLWSE